MKTKNVYTNRLINETSPYLLQHAYNPVDWHPWGEDAFEAAKRENKLIFLSIGYSTCHWCHVMEKESFEDEGIAKILNRGFISIKVDREERPDIDSIYMEVAMLVNGQGGWPLNLILTPDLHPVFAATYIPKEGNAYRMGMYTLLPQIEHMWNTEPERIVSTGRKIVAALREHNTEEELPPGSFSGFREDLQRIYRKAFSALYNRYDPEYGGFGEKPKFPQPHNYLFLLRHYLTSGDESSLEIVEKTLRSMRAGGIYDHIGFGFHRYSTDMEWKVPHFEKMLYDQAMLLLAYGEAYKVTGNETFMRTADELFIYLTRDMRSPEGAFYSAEDADSEGVEGKFYTWEKETVLNVLAEMDRDQETIKKYADYFNLEEEGNFLDEAKGRKNGENILYADADAEIPESKPEFERVRKTIFQVREQRRRPHLDDKILTDWNGLIIYALAKASWMFDNQDYNHAARKAAKFMLQEMKTAENGLLHSYRNGMKTTSGMLDDYAFFIRALLELYRSTFDPLYLREAESLARYAMEHFEDREKGGFFPTSEGTENILIRKKEIIDNSIPAGNSVMFDNLMRLYRLTGREVFKNSADGIIKTSMDELETFPQALTMLLSGLCGESADSKEIVLTGTEEAVLEMAKLINAELRPGTVVVVKTEERAGEIEKIAPYTAAYPVPKEGAAAYVCTNFTCRQPVFTTEELMSILDST